MKLRTILFLAGGLVAIAAAPVLADVNYTQGSGTVIFDFICFTTKHCSGHVPINSAGTEIATSSNPVRTDPTGTTTQPISAASLPSHPVTVVNGGVASGAMVDIGSQADAACGTDNGSCSLIALQKRGNQNATTINTTAAAPVAAGENHAMEIGSNQIKVQVAQTVTAASAYASGNAIGGLMTIAGAARLSGSLGAAGTGGILTGMMMNSKSLQTTQVDVVFFDANPTGSTCTDKTAFSLATADFDKVVGYLTVPGTAANGAGWVAGTVGSVGVATYYPLTYDLASSTSLFACAITRGTPTFTATTDVSFKFNALRN